MSIMLLISSTMCKPKREVYWHQLPEGVSQLGSGDSIPTL
jgi:hypothetical protein